MLNQSEVTLERILRYLQTPRDATNLLRVPDKEGYLAALRATNFWQIATTHAPQDVALIVLKDKVIEEDLEMSEHEYIPSSQAMDETPQDLQHVVKGALKVHKETYL